MDHIHILHSDPAMNVGLYAILALEEDWLLTRSSPDNKTSITADVCVADYETGSALANTCGDKVAILVVTQQDTEWDVRSALEAGVRGYVLQSCTPEELLQATRQVAAGGMYFTEAIAHHVAVSGVRVDLTGREAEVLQLLAKGYCNKLIARTLGIALETVKSHVKRIMGKLGASARTHAVAIATERGIIKS